MNDMTPPPQKVHLEFQLTDETVKRLYFRGPNASTYALAECDGSWALFACCDKGDLLDRQTTPAERFHRPFVPVSEGLKDFVPPAMHWVGETWGHTKDFPAKMSVSEKALVIIEQLDLDTLAAVTGACLVKAALMAPDTEIFMAKAYSAIPAELGKRNTTSRFLKIAANFNPDNPEHMELAGKEQRI